MIPSQEELLDAYRAMARIRAFESQALELSRDGYVAGSIHLCLGQEAIPVGAVAALEPQDRVTATYRGHGWALECGTDPVALMAEIAQRAAGVNGGRAGSPLLSDPEHGFFGENSIVGAGVPIAAGLALASELQNADRVVVTSIGDGAMNQGATMEGLAFAAARDLPVVFLCENNGWSEMTPIASMVRGDDFVARGAGFGIETFVVDGGDPFAVQEAVGRAAQAARSGSGPVLVECKTVRLSGHYNKDIEHYRSQEDRDRAAEADPLVRMRAKLNDDPAQSVEEIDRELAAEFTQLATTVRDLPPPDSTSALGHVYAHTQTPQDSRASSEPAKEISYFRAVNNALLDALEDDPSVILYGEDVAAAGGIFGVTRGLQKHFGSERVFDTPIAEAAILGSAVGASMEGVRPVVEIMWADFLFVALDQIVNQAANVRYINRSELAAPLTVRMQQGATPGSCAQHSRSIEGILAQVPGIKVGLPATPQDAYSMTRAAIADPDPTVLIEHRAMYLDSGEVVRGGSLEGTEGARIRRPGSDVAVLTWGSGVGLALDAAEQLAADGIEALVLDLRWLRPLDDAAIDAAVTAASGRVLVVHEAPVQGGFGAEVAARILDRHFNTLRAPVARVGSAPSPMPSAPGLQSSVLPSVQDVVAAARKRLGA